MYRGKYPQNIRSVSYTKQLGLYVQTNDRQWFYVRTADIPAGSSMPKLGQPAPSWVMQHPQQ